MVVNSESLTTNGLHFKIDKKLVGAVAGGIALGAGIAVAGEVINSEVNSPAEAGAPTPAEFLFLFHPELKGAVVPSDISQTGTVMIGGKSSREVIGELKSLARETQTGEVIANLTEEQLFGLLESLPPGAQSGRINVLSREGDGQSLILEAQLWGTKATGLFEGVSLVSSETTPGNELIGWLAPVQEDTSLLKDSSLKSGVNYARLWTDGQWIFIQEEDVRIGIGGGESGVDQPLEIPQPTLIDKTMTPTAAPTETPTSQPTETKTLAPTKTRTATPRPPTKTKAPTPKATPTREAPKPPAGPVRPEGVPGDLDLTVNGLLASIPQINFIPDGGYNSFMKRKSCDGANGKLSVDANKEINAVVGIVNSDGGTARFLGSYHFSAGENSDRSIPSLVSGEILVCTYYTSDWRPLARSRIGPWN